MTRLDKPPTVSAGSRPTDRGAGTGDGVSAMPEERASDGVRVARAALTRVAEPAGAALWQLVDRLGPVDALAEIRDRAVRGRPLPGLHVDRATDEHACADLTAVAAIGGRLVVPEDEEWPTDLLDGLRHIHSEDNPTMPPLALWVRGPARLSTMCRAAVAIVGARASTPYGNHVAGELGYGLADRGWTVVSGGAYGIDGAAHRGALAADGTTIAVLACGVDRAYPPGHAALFDRIVGSGALVGEWPPGATPQRWRFLVRNRLIAALTAGTVVVEAGARSGARQTARRADELSRAVLAVPGPVTSAMSVGCHRLVREAGAQLVTSAADVHAELGGLGEVALEPVRAPDGPRDYLGAAAGQVLEGVPARRPGSLAEIATQAGVPVLTAARELPGLATLGLVADTEQGWLLTDAGRSR